MVTIASKGQEGCPHPGFYPCYQATCDCVHTQKRQLMDGELSKCSPHSGHGFCVLGAQVSGSVSFHPTPHNPFVRDN